MLFIHSFQIPLSFPLLLPHISWIGVCTLLQKSLSAYLIFPVLLPVAVSHRFSMCFILCHMYNSNQMQNKDKLHTATKLFWHVCQCCIVIRAISVVNQTLSQGRYWLQKSWQCSFALACSVIFTAAVFHSFLHTESSQALQHMCRSWQTTTAQIGRHEHVFTRGGVGVRAPQTAGSIKCPSYGCL